MVISAWGVIELWWVAWLYHFFGLPVLSGWGPIRSLGLNRPARGFDWGLCDEIAGVLRCIRPGRHGGGLPYWSSCGAMVGGSKFARVPRLFLFCFLGRLAVGRESDLISRGFPRSTALISEPAPYLVGFPISRRSKAPRNMEERHD